MPVVIAAVVAVARGRPGRQDAVGNEGHRRTALDLQLYLAFVAASSVMILRPVPLAWRAGDRSECPISESER